MKTFIILSLLLSTVSSFAVEDSLKVLERNQVGPEVTCENCSDQTNCPQKIVDQLLNGELTFMGRDLLPGSDQNRSCVFRSATAYVIYRNCMSNKREAPATSISVIPFTGGMIDFYVENSSQLNEPISTLQRSQYDSTWRVSLAQTPVPGQLNMDGIKTYLRNAQSRQSGCYVGNSMAAQDMSQRGACYGGARNPQWLSDAEAFWKNPGPDWTRTLQHVRRRVNASY